MKQPKFWKTLERHPLSKEYEDIDGEIFKEMTATVKGVGVIGRKITLLDDQVLDGWQLLRACIEADVRPEFDGLPKDMDAEEFVKIKNDLRRPTLEQKAIARIKARLERVEEAKKAGQSHRTIAKKEGISVSQVVRDLNKKPPGVPPPGTPEQKPSKNGQKVVGLDKKTYPATKPEKPLCERCKRKGEIRDCSYCAELRKGTVTETKPEPGKPKFDDKKLTDAYGILLRQFDKRAELMGKGSLPSPQGERKLDDEALQGRIREVVLQKDRHGRVMELLECVLKELQLWRMQ